MKKGINIKIVGTINLPLIAGSILLYIINLKHEILNKSIELSNMNQKSVAYKLMYNDIMSEINAYPYRVIGGACIVVLIVVSIIRDYCKKNLN